MNKSEIESAVAHELWKASTYGDLEALAGVTDRKAFWRNHPTEATARETLKAMVRDEVTRKLKKVKEPSP
jgi:hypothetical protein